MNLNIFWFLLLCERWCHLVGDFFEGGIFGSKMTNYLFLREVCNGEDDNRQFDMSLIFQQEFTLGKMCKFESFPYILGI